MLTTQIGPQPPSRILSAIKAFFGRLLMVTGALSLLPLIVGLVMAAWPHTMAKQTVLKIELDGPMAEAQAPKLGRWVGGAQPLALDVLTSRIRRAAHDPRVVGLFLQVDAPQMGLPQLMELSRAIHVFEDSNKKVWSYLESSGGAQGNSPFAVAALAPRVTMAPSGDMELTGLRADVPFIKQLLQKLHIKAHLEQRYEYKNFADTFDQNGFTPAHKEALGQVLNDMQASLASLIAKERSLAPEVVASLFKEGPLSAQAAKTHGLIDNVAYADELDKEIENFVGKKEVMVNIADYQPPKRKMSKKTVALIIGAGEIDRGDGRASPWGGQQNFAAERYVEALRDAREDEVDAVLFRMDTPGGSYLASDLIRREVELTKKANIPVIVSMGNTAASGGYFIAAEADHIIAEASTITGSIGVVSMSLAFRETLQTFFGVHFDTFETVPKPGLATFLDPPTGAYQERLASEVTRVYDDFVEKVAKGRKLPHDKVAQLAKGRIYSGQHAQAIGLVDELGGMDTAMAHIKKRLDVKEEQALQFVAYPEPPTPWTLLRSALEQGGLAHIKMLAAIHAIGPYLTQLTSRQARVVAESGVPARL